MLSTGNGNIACQKKKKKENTRIGHANCVDHYQDLEQWSIQYLKGKLSVPNHSLHARCNMAPPRHLPPETKASLLGSLCDWPLRSALVPPEDPLKIHYDPLKHRQKLVSEPELVMAQMKGPIVMSPHCLWLVPVRRSNGDRQYYFC